MKLYKLRRMCFDHGVSVFPPEDKDLPDPPELAGEPWSENFRRLRFLGFTDYQAGHALKAWAYHAKYELHQSEQGIRRFVTNCVSETAAYKMPAEPVAWGLIILVACVVAVALGLYLWVTLDVESSVHKMGHKWAYVMSYQEYLWQAELLFVSAAQKGVYEQCGDLGSVVAIHQRDTGPKPDPNDIFFFHERLYLKGRRLIFYHWYKFHWWAVFYCGVLTHLSGRRYTLRPGGREPYMVKGPWLRPGGDWGTPEYRGCWQEWWWL